MQQLTIFGIELHAFHGCLPEERIIGTTYTVDICMTGNFSLATETDNLTHAIDYVKVSDIVAKEMKTSSNLIEHVGGRILKSLRKEFPQCEKIKVSVAKAQPPATVYFRKAVFETEG